MKRIAELAENIASVELGQACMNADNNLAVAVSQLIRTAQYIEQTSTDSDVVASAEEILEMAEEAKECYKRPEPYEPAEGPPVPKEPPIEDEEPASRV
jgi:hypothetical protein